MLGHFEQKRARVKSRSAKNSSTRSPLTQVMPLGCWCTPSSPTDQGLDTTTKKRSRKCCNSDSKMKNYIGVRVKMTVKEMLRNVRIAKGWNPHDFEENCSSKLAKGGRRRVNTSMKCQPYKSTKKQTTQSLEDLSIILEVLEQDLKSGHTYRPLSNDMAPSSQSLSSEYTPVTIDNPMYSYTIPGFKVEEQLPRSTDYCLSLNSPSDEYPSLQGVSSHPDAWYNSDEMPSPQSSMTSSPDGADYYQAWSLSEYPSFCHPGYDQQDSDGGSVETQEEWVSPQNQYCNQKNEMFFRTQLRKEQLQLEDISDTELLATDGHGRTALHRVVCQGKRALAYAIAKRMVAINCLDLKDSNGMTALHLAAKHNQHLMVADLIHLGTSVNERDNSGKTCLHHSAENGYIRVLEVLKNVMHDNVYVDVEATDKHGLSVLQCTAMAVSATMRKLDSSTNQSQTRLHTLHKEQMMETLECLLQMGSYFPGQGRCVK